MGTDGSPAGVEACAPRTPPHFLRRLLRTLSALVAAGVGLSLLTADLYPIDALDPPRVAGMLEHAAMRADALRFPLGCLAGAAALLLFVSRFARLGTAALLVCAWALVPALLPLRAERPARPDAPSLSVLSINLAVDRATNERVLEEVRRAHPDVLLFQEYTLARSAVLRAALDSAYTTRIEFPRNDAFGMAVYARVAIHGHERFFLADSRTPQLRLEATLGEQPLVIYGIHLVPVHAGLYDRHRREFVDLVARLEPERDPVVLLGDFNFVTHGALGQALAGRGYLDTHALAGSGRGPTWPVQLMALGIPGIRLDHIFVGPGLACCAASCGAPTGSDHLPIGAEITLAAP